jgi:hypothetical protein
VIADEGMDEVVRADMAATRAASPAR